MLCFKKIFHLLSLVLLFASCTSVRMHIAIPDKFMEQAEKLPVKIVGRGWGKKPLSFGPYKTSGIKRSWTTTTSRYDRNTNVTIEERLLRVFNIEKGAITKTERHRFKFTIQDGHQIAEVFAMERQVTEGTQIIRNSRWLSELYAGKNFQYSFAAVIIPQSTTQPHPWNLVMYSTHDWSQKKKIFEMSDFQEDGLLTRGSDTITIKTINVQRVVTDKGVEHSMPFALPMIYELRIDDGVCAVIDTWGKVLWVYREMDEPMKFAVAAVASAVLSRRVQNRVGGG